jgi:hypothetical protein
MNIGKNATHSTSVSCNHPVNILKKNLTQIYILFTYQKKNIGGYKLQSEGII